MLRHRIGILAFGALALLLSADALAVTREIANLNTAPLTLRQSVISELSDGILRDPYDDFLLRPYNLNFVNIERHPNLSPWPGQEGEQNRYVDFLVGNNGNSNVRDGSDTLQGTYIGQSMEKFTWGVSAAYLTNDLGTANTIGVSGFTTGEQLTGVDARFAAGYRVSNRMVLGGGVSLVNRGNEARDGSFEDGVGGFFSLQDLQQSGVEADFGLRRFNGESRSWEAGLRLGMGNTEVNDYSDILDGTGAVESRFVVTEYDLGERYAQLFGGYNHRFQDHGGEMQIRGGLRNSSRELDNSNLSYTDDMGTITPSLVLLDQDPVTENEFFVSADTLFVRGWTQIFAGARLSLSQVEGSTRVDSLGNVVDESIDDSRTGLALVMGLRQPLWNEKFRLVARARADWRDQTEMTSFGSVSSEAELTRTTTQFAIGVETVLNNMVFDLAWLFGGDPAPGGANEPSRQTIDLDRLVISATFGW